MASKTPVSGSFIAEEIYRGEERFLDIHLIKEFDFTSFQDYTIEILSEVRKIRNQVSKPLVFRDSILDGWIAPGIGLSQVYMYNTSLRGVDLERADFTKSRLEKCHFKIDEFEEGANLRGAKFGGSIISSYFKGADLKGANLAGCNLRGSTFEDCDMDKNTILDGANLNGARVIGKTPLYVVNTTKANLVGAELNDFYFQLGPIEINHVKSLITVIRNKGIIQHGKNLMTFAEFKEYANIPEPKNSVFGHLIQTLLYNQQD